MNVIVDNLYDDSRQMHCTRDVWFEKFYKQAIDLVWKDDTNHYFKEKYWRFDTSYWWGKPWIIDELLELEAESEKCCQRCGKHRFQIWTNRWRIEHWCIPCYIYVLFNRIMTKLKV